MDDKVKTQFPNPQPQGPNVACRQCRRCWPWPNAKGNHPPRRKWTIRDVFCYCGLEVTDNLDELHGCALFINLGIGDYQ